MQKRGIGPSDQMLGQKLPPANPGGIVGPMNPTGPTNLPKPQISGPVSPTGPMNLPKPTMSGPISPNGLMNLPPSPMNNQFDPKAFEKLLSGQQLQDFRSLGRNIGGDYSAFARNAGGDIQSVLNKRYGVKGKLAGPSWGTASM